MTLHITLVALISFWTLQKLPYLIEKLDFFNENLDMLKFKSYICFRTFFKYF